MKNDFIDTKEAIMAIHLYADMWLQMNANSPETIPPNEFYETIPSLWKLRCQKLVQVIEVAPCAKQERDLNYKDLDSFYTKMGEVDKFIQKYRKIKIERF